MKVNIRQLMPSEFELIAQLDCSRTTRARYVWERDAAHPLHLSLSKQIVDPPEEKPSWGAGERRFRCELWRKNIAQDGCIMFGGFHDDRLAGIAMVGPLADGITAELYTLYVHRPYRRQGIGNALVDQAESQCRQWGRSQILIYTEYDAEAVDFYLARRYRIVGIQDPCVQTKNFSLTFLGLLGEK